MCTTNIKQRRMAQMCRIPRHSVMNCFIWIVAWRSMLTIITLSSIILLLLSTNVVNGLESSLSEIDINPDTSKLQMRNILCMYCPCEPCVIVLTPFFLF